VLSKDVASGTVVASVAARELLSLFRPGVGTPPQAPLRRKGRSS